MSTNGQLVFTDVDKITFKGVGNTSNAVVDTVTGKIGVGIDSPDANLHVLGNSYVSTNLELGGTLIMGTVNVSAHHSLEAVTAEGNTTPLTIEFTNTDTSLMTTGNVEVGKELVVSGNTETKNINMLHTANTASIKLNSNVVTEFPRSKKLIKYPRVLLTSAALNSAYENGYRVTFSSENTSYRAYHPFSLDENSAVGWHSSNGTTGLPYDGTGGLYGTSGTARLAAETERGEWLGLELPVAIKLERLRMVSQSYSPAVNTIDDFIVYAKKQSGDTWNNIGTFTGIARLQNSAAGAMFDVNVVEYYKFFAIVATKRDAAAANSGVSIRVLEYFGVPEYDPEADGVDVTVKSLPNVPNTDWLEVYYDGKDLTDGAVTSVDDLTPGGTNDGTPYGGVTVSDGAFVLDGTNDYITTPALGFSGDQVHSVSLWFWSDKPQSDMTTEHGIYGIGRSINPLNNTNSARGGLSWWSPATQPNSSLRFWHSGSAGRNFPGTTFLEGKWNHVLIVYPGGGAFNIRAWLNGVELTGANGTGSGGNNYDFNWNTNDHIILGDWYTGTGTVKLQSPWDGKIANFRLFNRALTTDEIYQLYAYQKEYFGHGDLSMTLKAGRLGIGTSEPRALLDVGGEPFGPGSRPIFRALSDSSSTLSYDATQGATRIFTNEFNSAHINVTNSYSTSTGRFTAPIPGYYFFEFQILIAVPVANWGTIQLSLYKNGVNVNQATTSRGLSYYWVNNVDPGPDSFSHLNTPSCRAILYLNRGDYVQAGYPSVASSTASTSFEYSKNYAFFQGYLLST